MLQQVISLANMIKSEILTFKGKLNIINTKIINKANSD